MKIFPAIDILNDCAVRLTKGDFESAKTYSADPVDFARKFEAAGAKYLHVVDLDGTKYGRSVSIKTIAAIQRETGLRLQVGGGIRTLEDAMRLINEGVERIIIGSLAVQDPSTVASLFQALGPGRITLALDCQNCDSDTPLIAVNGWQTRSNRSLWEMVSYYRTYGVSRILCTDIERDGAGCGSNLFLYRRLLERYPGLNVQASGGIATLAELTELASMGIESCVIGKSFYESQFSVSAALTIQGASC